MLLPQELVDLIIDDLQDDMDTLRQCSLVSRGWVQPSSAHLFHSLRWPSCTHSAWEHDTLSRCKCLPTRCPCDLHGFIKFIRGSARVRAALRELHLSFGSPYREVKCPAAEPARKSGGCHGFARRHLTSVRELMCIIDMLPRLRHLDLLSLGFESSQRYTDSEMSLEGIRDIHHLTLTSPICNLDDPSATAFLRCFKRISTLTLVDIASSFPRALPPPPPTRPPRAPNPSHRPQIHSLTFHSCTSRGVALALTALHAASVDFTALSALALTGRAAPLVLAEPSSTLHTITAFTCSIPNLAAFTCTPTATCAFLLRLPPACPALRTLAVHSACRCLVVSSAGESAGTMVGGDGDAQVHRQRIAGWDRVFNVLESPFMMHVDALRIEFCMHSRVTPGNCTEVLQNVRATLEALDWTLLDRAAARLGTLDLKLVLAVWEKTLECAGFPQKRVLEVMEQVARERFTFSVQEIVKLEVSVQSWTECSLAGQDWRC